MKFERFQISRRIENRRRHAASSARAFAGQPIELLEARQLLSVAASAAIPAVTSTVNGAATQVQLSSYFSDSSVTGTLVRMVSNEGNIDLQLTDTATPVTVSNFLHYVNSGAYSNSLIHRSTNLNGDGIAVVQGGGFAPGSTPSVLPTSAPIVNESDPSRPNALGTIAMARTSSVNSATDQWFINASDNSSALNGAAGQGYAVFGTVIDGTMATVNAINALPTSTATASDSESLTEFPVTTVANDPPSSANEVIVSSAAVLPSITYSIAANDNPSVVSASISNGTLSLGYGASVGVANITVQATDHLGNSVTQSFAVTVQPSAVQLSASGTRSLTFTDADGTHTVVSVKGPGNATVNFNGTNIVQTANAARHSVAVAGNGVSLDDVTVDGATSATTLVITGRGGNHVVEETGDIAINSAVGAVSAPQLALSGNLTVNGAIRSLALGNVTGGAISIGGSSADTGARIVVGAATDASMTITQPVAVFKAASLANSDNTADVITSPSIQTLNVGGNSAEVFSISGALTKATIHGADSGSITAGSIGKFVAGSGSANLSSTGGVGSVLFRGTSSGAVNVASAGTLASVGAWSGDINVTGDIGTINVHGDMTANVAANTIGKFNVNANLTGSTITLSAPWAADDLALSRLNVGRAVTNVTLNAASNLGVLTAGSISGSAIYSAMDLNSGNALPAAADEFANPGTIAVVKVRGTFASTDIAAAAMGKFALGTIVTANAGTPFGLGASSTAGIFSLTAKTDANQKLRFNSIKDPAAVANQITAQGLNLGDFTIDIVAT